MTQHRSTGQMSTGSGLDTRSDRDPGTVGSPQRSARSRLRWRVLDLVVLAVLAAASGVIFWAWSALVYPLSQAVTVGYPPAGGLLVGGWLMAGPLGALIIRRPGAALACELLAASFQGLLGTTFGATVVISGLIQGAAAEVVFLAFGYRRFGPTVA
ncbi:MAG: ECF transporter S component, partial [Micrococcales bacterium]|nr:ECF transporter S component [Micrococcales bacterium]